MTSPLFISVAFGLATSAAAWLWGLLVAIGINKLPEPRSPKRRDIRTW